MLPCYTHHDLLKQKISAIVINKHHVIIFHKFFHIFHIFSLPNLSKILYYWNSILMCMTNLLICTYIHLNRIAFFKKAHKHAYPPPPRTVTVNFVKIGEAKCIAAQPPII